MDNFLKKLADKVSKNINHEKIAVVFPSKRAGLHFKKILAGNLKAPAWSPEVFSIEDFIYELTPLKNPGKIKLLFELFTVYKTFSYEQDFNTFFQWGEIILNDFDIIDKSLVNAADLFRNIREHKQVEEQFKFDFEDTPEFKRFWESFSTKDLSPFQELHIKTWEILANVYNRFKITLKKKGLAYDGMIYREAADYIKKNQPLPWKKILFAGFNALSKAEISIITQLMSVKKADVLIDADRYYTDDDKQEAGLFIRKYKKFFNTTEWTDDCYKNKNVHIIGSPLNVSQAKVLNQILGGMTFKGNEEKTAVILPDAAMLIPVLSSIPSNISALNVTMGFPLKNTIVYNLLKLMNNLQVNRKGDSSSPVFYHEDVLKILMHPYIKFYNISFNYSLVNDIKKNNIVYVNSSKLTVSEAPEILKIIFKPLNTAEAFFDYYNNVLDLVSAQLRDSESENDQAAFELEFVYNLYLQLNTLRNIMGDYDIRIDPSTFTKLFDDVLKNVKVPFTGEPLKGLQVMGLLESRCLDFENVFIMSMNEDIVPSGNTNSSFIPYALKKSFGIPTFEEDDANTAYYVYRLIQKAKNVYLIYNTEPGKIFTGEKSRFILQMENELNSYNKSIKVHSQIYTAEPVFYSIKPINITKSEALITKIKNLPYLSQTDIASYINCPLQFYFKKIAGLKEEEILDEYFSPATFGNILHEILRILYEAYKGKQVLDKDIKSIRKELNIRYDEILKEAFLKIDVLKQANIHQSGKNLLYKNIIKTLANFIIDNDAKNVPFSIEEVEKRFEHELEIKVNGEISNVKLMGRFDRVDFKDGYFRVVDYKTGYVDIKYDKQVYQVFNSKDFSRQRTFFQAYYYAYLFNKSQHIDNVKVAIYPVKTIMEGVTEKIIKAGELNVFEEKLTALLQEMYNPETLFEQTTHLDNCTYCPYKKLCYR